MNLNELDMCDDDHNIRWLLLEEHISTPGELMVNLNTEVNLFLLLIRNSVVPFNF